MFKKKWTTRRKANLENPGLGSVGYEYKNAIILSKFKVFSSNFTITLKSDYKVDWIYRFWNFQSLPIFVDFVIFDKKSAFGEHFDRKFLIGNKLAGSFT